MNLNIADCLVYKKGWGQDYVHNICDQSMQIIPWSLGDYVQVAALGALAVLITFILGICIIGLSRCL